MVSSEFVEGLAPAGNDGALLVTNPWIWITALLIAALILWLGWHYGSVTSEEDLQRKRREAVDGIYDRINEKARAAASASRDSADYAARSLNKEIKELLGPVILLTPFGRRATALERALAGLPTSRDHGDPEPPADEGGAGQGGHGEGHGHAPSGDGHGHAPAAGHPATANSPPTAMGSQINISIGGGAPAPGHGPGHDAHPPAPAAALSAVRAAVMDICDYWSRSTMKDELRAAQTALLRKPPPPPAKPGSH